MTDASLRQLHVGFDREIFVRQSRGGISRYFAELMAQFDQDQQLQISPHLLFARCSNEHLRERVPEATSQLPALRSVPRGLPRLVNAADPIKDAYLRFRAGTTPASPKLDWLHASYLRPMASDLARAPRLAITVYDMTPELLHLDTSSGPYRGKAELARRADLILTISRTTAEQFNALMPGSEGKVVSIPLGVQSMFFERLDGSGPAVDFPYLLFVGSRAQYKRFDLLLAALAELREQGHDLGLVIAGPALAEQERAQVLAHLPADRVHASTPADQELVGLYRHARAFVFPSQHEGFGLPILEAFAASCPVVATDIPVFREVAGDAACYFEGSSAESLTQAVLTTITDEVGREQRVTAGHSRARAASWHATAEATAAAYRQFS